MGEIAESLINGEFDSLTGEYIGPPVGYPRTLSKKERSKYYKSLSPAEKKIASIRKEIAMLCQSGTDINEARRQMNAKYGKGWRDRGLIVNDDNQWTEEELAPFK